MKKVNSEFTMRLLEGNQISFGFFPQDIEELYLRLRMEMEYSEALLKA